MSRRKPPGRYHHGDLRAALLVEAARVAAEEGVHAVQVKRLGQALGVSTAAPFRHFSSRQALLVAAAEEALRRRQVAVEHAIADESDPLERSRAEAVAHVRWAATHRGWYRLLTRPELLAASETIRRAQSVTTARLQAALAAVDASGEGSGDWSAAAQLTARALVHGLAQMVVGGHLGEVSPDEAERLALAATAVLGRGLAGLAQPAPRSTAPGS